MQPLQPDLAMAMTCVVVRGHGADYRCRIGVTKDVLPTGHRCLA